MARRSCSAAADDSIAEVGSGRFIAASEGDGHWVMRGASVTLFDAGAVARRQSVRAGC
jgi:hypothetical protein